MYQASSQIFSDLTVVIPTYNEALTIGNLLQELSARKINALVVDDGDDNLEDICKKYSNVTYIRGNNGESESVLKGIELSKTPIIAVMDADGSHPVDTLIEMYHTYKSASKSNECLIVGSRYIQDGGTKGKFINTLFSRVGNFLTRKFLGIKTKDSTGRFILGTRGLLLQYDVWYGRGDSSIAIIYNVEKNFSKLFVARVLEVPFTYIPRKIGEGRTTSLIGLIKYSVYYSLRLLSLKIERFKFYTDRTLQQGISKDETGELNPNITYSTIALNILLTPIFWILALSLYIIPFSKLIITNYPQSILGYILRFSYYKLKLGYCGKDIFIDKNVNIWNPKTVLLYDGCRIDANVNIKTGKDLPDILICYHHSSIHQNSIINAKGGVTLGEESCIGANCAVYASTNTSVPNQLGEFPTYSYAAPMKLQSVKKGNVYIGPRCYIGTNSVLINTRLLGFNVLGANSFIKDLTIQAFQTWAGTPAQELNVKIQRSKNQELELVKDTDLVGV